MTMARQYEPGYGRRGGSFRWDTIETTALGATYLSQIKAAERAKR
jgi:hypothetical protein